MSSSNDRRWAELVTKWGAMPNKIETDRDGNINMSPPADGDHGDRQAEIVYQLKGSLRGRVITKCGVSTSAGTKVPDVAWFSPEHPLVLEAGILAAKPAPEICVEILSLDDTGKEIQGKAALYFEAGAREVWICDLEGKVCFLSQSAELSISSLFPRFPKLVLTYPERLSRFGAAKGDRSNTDVVGMLLQEREES
jgi:Uma2 family endonuclease